MSSWDKLPIELLYNIFDFLEKQKFEVETTISKHILLPKRDALECQLTCKNWNRPAKMAFYKTVLLRSLKQLKSINRALENSVDDTRLMVESVFLENGNCSNEKVWIATYLTSVPNLCPNLKTVTTTKIPIEYYWVLLMQNWYEGKLLKLKSIPSPPACEPNSVECYELAAWALRETHDDLTVYDWLSLPNTNIQKLQYFANLKYLKLSIKDCQNTFKIDKYIQEWPSTITSLCIQNENKPKPLTTASPLIFLQSTLATILKY